MKKIVILTGSEIRHEFFRKVISNDKNIDVIASFCEGKEKSLEEIVKKNKNSSQIEINHIIGRNQSEIDFFSLINENIFDNSNPIFIKKGEINNQKIVEKISKLNPDLLVCYGSSLIKSSLIEKYNGRFLNVHLGLSPYYRGCGTNVWPLINYEADLVGATFMHLDSGIDTGKIIHQIRAKIFLGDSPHSIGNRLIKDMTNVYKSIIIHFDDLEEMEQPKNIRGKLYLNKDFDQNACKKLYSNFKDGLVEKYLIEKKNSNIIIENPMF